MHDIEVYIDDTERFYLRQNYVSNLVGKNIHASLIVVTFVVPEPIKYIRCL